MARISARREPAALDVSVVIVNWNAGAHLAACVERVKRAAGALAVEVIVVDNASTDDSVARADATGAVDRVVVNGHNAGFTVANNQGARLARGRFVLFLNPDTLPEPGALPALVRTLERNPRIGVLAPRLLDEQRRPSRDMGHRFPTPRTVASSFLLLGRVAPRLFPGMTRETDVRGLERCDWACGAALLVRRDVWERVGWNETLFLHGEDIDFCARVREHGWEVAVTGDADVVHMAGRSIARQHDATLLWDTPSGIALHLRRHNGPLGTRLALAAMRLGMRARRLAHAALYRLTGDPDRLRKAHKLGLFLAQDRAREPRR
jgi:N-acetylglucosaminyl-diphospho-decaprenol L-rhamnosyltransferase